MEVLPSFLIPLMRSCLSILKVLTWTLEEIYGSIFKSNFSRNIFSCELRCKPFAEP